MLDTELKMCLTLNISDSHAPILPDSIPHGARRSTHYDQQLSFKRAT